MVDSSTDHGTHPDGEALPPPPAVYTLRLIQITSLVYATRRGVREAKGSVDELRKFYKSVRVRT